MNKKFLALVLALMMVLSLSIIPAWADEDNVPLTEEPLDAEGVLRFEGLAERMRSHYYTILALEENIATIRASDYEKMEEQLRDGLNKIADAQWQALSPDLSGLGPVGEMLGPIASMMGASTAQSLQTQYDAMREQFDAIRSGELQQDHADLIRQIENAENTIVMMGETMYLTRLALEDNMTALDRQAAALERTIEEMELRYQLGQISALTLNEVKSGKTQLESVRQTLQMNLDSISRQLNAMVGEDLTANLSVERVDWVNADQLASMDLEKDLERAKAASYDLYAAKKTLDEADEAFQDAADEYNRNEKNYEYVQAEHVWQAAQYTYHAEVQNFELTFRALYAQVKDNQQLVEAAKVQLACEQENYNVDELKYQQGNISHNALLTAHDDLQAAQDAVTSAEYDLLTAYNNYRWAVDFGLLNG